jgi:predicted transcriptional regulator
MIESNANTAAEIAAEHGITPRRVRQYVTEGRLPRLRRGRFDALYFACMRSGESLCPKRHRKPAALVLVALGWLHAGDREDRELFVGMLKENGLQRADAVGALGEAKALLRSARERC